MIRPKYLQMYAHLKERRQKNRIRSIVVILAFFKYSTVVIKQICWTSGMYIELPSY